MLRSPRLSPLSSEVSWYRDMKDILDRGAVSTQLIFAQQMEEEETFHQRDLIQLLPYGLSMTTDAQRPVLLLRDEAHVYTLPVALSPIEAGISLSQANKLQPESSPHKFTATLMSSLGIDIKQAVFVEIKGADQYLRLYMSGHPRLNSVKLRAQEAMSLCLYLDVPIYATKSFIGLSRVMATSFESSAQNPKKLSPTIKGTGYLN